MNELFSEIWLSPVQRYISLWNPREYEPCLDLINSWLELFPAEFKKHLVDNVLMVRFLGTLREWQPT